MYDQIADAISHMFDFVPVYVGAISAVHSQKIQEPLTCCCSFEQDAKLWTIMSIATIFSVYRAKRVVLRKIK